ncbi:hypothetical protein MNEG_7261 [Monoraphidium neglectum]|jgi:hypothetical protein|uniref:Uncharacterized protein n=1 Tax=Monoraphidium neglectum TaxID=145388 RepID=A0A0D2N3R0_9CHLO|nr:hypothetical protein MNEG_7261 [Monoraphidium neglectum]KIZ00701.1 hypothetical protein MNEG_7261 [Monoraphidium neglectum]|eukprot:XP_013899720.1 hypothetical protein MNEG_7261 [Monoraphidium neglectum]
MEGSAKDWDPASALRSYAAAAAQHPRLYTLTLSHQLRQQYASAAEAAAAADEHAAAALDQHQAATRSFWDEIL